MSLVDCLRRLATWSSGVTQSLSRYQFPTDEKESPFAKLPDELWQMVMDAATDPSLFVLVSNTGRESEPFTGDKKHIATVSKVRWLPPNFSASSPIHVLSDNCRISKASLTTGVHQELSHWTVKDGTDRRLLPKLSRIVFNKVELYDRPFSQEDFAFEKEAESLASLLNLHQERKDRLVRSSRMVGSGLHGFMKYILPNDEKRDRAL